MIIQDYQNIASKFAIYKEQYKVTYPALGLASEAGEVSDKVKKVLRDNDGEFDPTAKTEIAKEIGDVLWYCAALCGDLDITLEQCAQMNLDKLNSRLSRNVINGSGDNR